MIERYDMDFAVLVGESSHLAISNLANPNWAAALASAYNDRMINRWFSADERFLGSIFVATQDPETAAREIERVADHPQFVQVALGSGTRFPYGQRYYHPIYATAERHGLPIAIHPFTEGAGIAYAPTAAGYPSHYIEFHTCIPGSLQVHLVSMICEGIFETFPGLKLVIMEGGISWLPSLLWRLDKNWKSLRSEVPWVKRKPSHYAADHVRLTTQPLEEPEHPRHLRQILDMFPAERMLMFSSDYPHWDSDNPTRVLSHFPKDMQRRISAENARQLYGLPDHVRRADPAPVASPPQP
ncbi:MAG: amidohydrolase [Bacteroidetes bacterium]|nr:amidohydrolase [Bacteroidota bacterium]